MQADGRIEQYAKKERLQIERERLALEKNLSGIKEMKRLPDVDLRDRHEQRGDRRQGSQPAWHSGRRGRRYELQPGRGHLSSFPAMTTRCAPSGCSPRESRTQSSKDNSWRSRRRAKKPPSPPNRLRQQAPREMLRAPGAIAGNAVNEVSDVAVNEVRVAKEGSSNIRFSR